MGGCRCTYKNCSLKSDGVTHMFHYPVFDKVRCHQWLTNAQKLEFLNLKVSQLRNRVVCQHHFRDDNFMNFLKDKLTFNAVPTLDGPYCDTKQLMQIKQEKDVSKLYTITLKDIETDYLTLNDKKANFSVKYGDFLTNCDLMDLDSMNITNDNTQIVMKRGKYVEEEGDVTTTNKNINHEGVAIVNPFLNNLLEAYKNDVQVTEVPIEIDRLQENTINPIVNEKPIQVPDKNVTVLTHKPKPRSKRITIIEEKNIGVDPVPLPFPVKLEPISASAILTLPNRKRNLNMDLQQKDDQRMNLRQKDNLKMNLRSKDDQKMDLRAKDDCGKNFKVAEPGLAEGTNVMDHNIHNTVDVFEQTDKNKHQTRSSTIGNRLLNKKNNIEKFKDCLPQDSQRNVVICVKPKKVSQSLLKNRIPPERMAAIEEKRKFNMKLRDIIASCLDKLDNEETNMNDNSKDTTKMKDSSTDNIKSYLSKETVLPGLQDYTVAYLEARMKKMEDILLHKIDQNTQRIIEIKNFVTPTCNKKVAQTQTILNEEVKKKQLYDEISKFLSPEANSLLYEELFINKYVQDIQGRGPAKKKKCR